MSSSRRDNREIPIWRLREIELGRIPRRWLQSDGDRVLGADVTSVHVQIVHADHLHRVPGIFDGVADGGSFLDGFRQRQFTSARYSSFFVDG